MRTLFQIQQESREFQLAILHNLELHENYIYILKETMECYKFQELIAIKDDAESYHFVFQKMPKEDSYEAIVMDYYLSKHSNIFTDFLVCRTI